ncbi:MAG TPA: hypothetical protein VMB51_01940 [Solirubrobacteraceae bacterium]|nr:hypothetical protein [Solirubrobacteraceae bacterium]
MALGANALVLLDLLRGDGRASNRGTLRRNLKLSDANFDLALDELVGAGLATLVGKRRVARTTVGASDLSVDAAMLLAALPGDGSTVGSYNLRSKLNLDDSTYAQAKAELRSADLIKVGVGYGGTVARTSVLPGATEASKLSAAGLVKLEKELYEPFVEWLRSSLADQGLAFAEARVTATPRGYKSDSGQWSRPDITAVHVFKYDWLPEITVEVSSYEIKRASDARKLESVYEAAAHGRWAHRASLVVEHADDNDVVPAPIFDEIGRFRLGLYAMRSRPRGGFEVREIIKPPLTQESQPEDVNELIGYFLGEKRELRNSYLKAIGQ